jgi:hypothetical protein
MKKKTNRLKTKGLSSKGKKEDTTVAIKLPDEISIELVQANEIRHYEIFTMLSTLFSSAAVGFWTASFDQNDSVLKWVGGVFSAFTLIFIIFAIHYRQNIFHGSIKKIAKISDFKKEGGENL